MIMKWSQYSENIFDTFQSKECNILVQAVPGAGKTTNIRHLWTLEDKPTVYLVFNKHVQLEAQAKLPEKRNSTILTLNGLGFQAVLTHFGKVTLDDKKVQNIIKSEISYSPLLEWKEKRERQFQCAKAVAMMKCLDTGNGISYQVFNDMLSQHDLESYDGMYQDVKRVLEINDRQTKVIDFADQLRLPVIYNLPLPSFHTVLGDEVQDFNPVQLALIQKIEAEKYVLVGDKRQSLYAFRGAMSNAMQEMKEEFRCVELPLSITYRCATAIVGEAAKLYPEIEAWDESPIGEVRYSTAEKEGFGGDSIVLCRMNKPLITLAYTLLNQGIPCYVRGRDIGLGLINLIKKHEVSNVRELLHSLHAEYLVELEKAHIKEDDARAQRVEDKYTSAFTFCEKCSLNDHPNVVIENINSVFQEGRGICLTTVHKAKGLEAEKALLLDTPLYKVFQARAKYPWQREQEVNIEYVAVTRAKRELVYL